MARQIVIHTWCDIHLADGENVEGQETPPLSLVPGTPRILALCEVHQKELLEPLVAALAELGQPVEGQAAPAPSTRQERGYAGRTDEDRAPCPICGKVSLNRRALSSHTRQQHHKTLGQVEEEYRGQGQGQGQGQEPLTLEYQCPQCEFRSSKPQGIGAHRVARHRWRSVDNPGEPVYFRVNQDGSQTPGGKPGMGRGSASRREDPTLVELDDDAPDLLSGADED